MINPCVNLDQRPFAEPVPKLLAKTGNSGLHGQFVTGNGVVLALADPEKDPQIVVLCQSLRQTFLRAAIEPK